MYMKAARLSLPFAPSCFVLKSVMPESFLCLAITPAIKTAIRINTLNKAKVVFKKSPKRREK